MRYRVSIAGLLAISWPVAFPLSYTALTLLDEGVGVWGDIYLVWFIVGFGFSSSRLDLIMTYSYAV